MRERKRDGSTSPTRSMGTEQLGDGAGFLRGDPGNIGSLVLCLSPKSHVAKLEVGTCVSLVDYSSSSASEDELTNPTYPHHRDQEISSSEATSAKTSVSMQCFETNSAVVSGPHDASTSFIQASAASFPPSSSSSSPCDSGVLDQVLECLTRLHLSLVRLSERELFPSHTDHSGLISNLEKIEELYETIICAVYTTSMQ